MFSWHAIPFARILLPFIIGIFIAMIFPFGYTLPVFIFTFLFCFSCFLHLNANTGLKFRLKIISGIFITLIFLLSGYLRTFCFNERCQPDYFINISGATFYNVTIDDAIVEKEKYYRCYAKVNSALDSTGRVHPVNGTLLLYLRKGPGLQKPVIGNKYLVKATVSGIQKPANPGEFDYQKYLSYHQIFYQLFTDASKFKQIHESQNSIYRFATLFRNNALIIIKKYIDSPKESGVAEALLLGFKDDLDPDITAAFSRTGTLHVLAVSGLHAGIIYLILAFLTGSLTKIKHGKTIQVIIVLTGIWLYAFITGLSSSVLRASVMFSFMAVGQLFRYHVNIYNNIFSSAFILLLYNPYFIVDVGFQLSYLAVLGIVFIQPMIAHWYTPRYWLDKYAWGLVSVSFAAQLLTFPISIFYFHQFPNYFLFSNFLIIPITSILLIGLIALLALHVIPFAGYFLGKGLFYMLQFNNRLVQWIDNLPYSYSNGLHFNLSQMFIVYAILFTFLAFCIHKHKFLLFSMLILMISLGSYFTVLRLNHYNQRIMAVHVIKGHDVFTCIDGRNATIISDSIFLENSSAIKFYLEPFFWSHGISNISKLNLQNSFYEKNILNIKNVGFQFYDRILTIDQALPLSVQKKGIFLMKNYKRQFFEHSKTEPPSVKFSAIISANNKEKIKRQYFKYFKNKLKEDKSFILISF